MMPHLQAMHPVPEQSYRVRTVPYPHEELRSGMLQRVYLKFSPMPEMGYGIQLPQAVLIFGTACTSSDSAIVFTVGIRCPPPTACAV